MKGFLCALLQDALITIFLRPLDPLLSRLFPTYQSKHNDMIEREREREIKKKKILYYSDKTTDHMRDFYGDTLYTCKIGNTSKKISHVVRPEWATLNIDAYSNKNIVQYVRTTECDYPVRQAMIEKRKRWGQRLFDGPTHFLHQIVFNQGNIHFEIGTYSYFQRISFVDDFEQEGFAWIYRGKQTRTKLRKKHLPVPTSASLTTYNTLPIGCDTVVALVLGGKYHICVHKREFTTVNYPDATMVTPTFGLERLEHPGIENQLLHAALQEYAEELFNRKEVENKVNRRPCPTYFYSDYQEVADMLQLLEQGKAEFILNGCGFDAIGGFLNLSTLLIVHDEDSSQKIYRTAKGNWEAQDGTCEFIPIDDRRLEELLQTNMLSPASAFAISRAISILNP